MTSGTVFGSFAAENTPCCVADVLPAAVLLSVLGVAASFLAAVFAAAAAVVGFSG